MTSPPASAAPAATPGTRSLSLPVFDGRHFFLFSPLLLIAVWQLLSLSGWFPDTLLVPPSQVLQTAIELWSDGTLLDAAAGSLTRLAAGFGIGTLAGLAVGALFALAPAAERYCGLGFSILRQVPVVSLAPLFVLVLGIGESFKIAMIALAAFFPVALNTFDGIRDTPRAYLDVAAVLRFGRWPLLRRVLLPYALPSIATGLRLALSRSWTILVAAELFASNNGFGHLMDEGRQFFQIDMVMVGVILTGAIGFAFDLLLQALERRLSRWQGTQPQTSGAAS